MTVSSAKSFAEELAAAGRLHSAALHLLRLVRVEDARTGIGPARLSALSVLVFGGPKSLGELAAIEQVKPPTMSRIVEALERDGLVQRQRVGEDRRRVRLMATRKGHQVMERGRQRRVSALAKLIAQLSPEDVSLLNRAAELMERVVAAARVSC